MALHIAMYTYNSMLFKWNTVQNTEFKCDQMYNTFIPKVCVVTRWGRSGGVVTVARDEIGDVS